MIMTKTRDDILTIIEMMHGHWIDRQEIARVLDRPHKLLTSDDVHVLQALVREGKIIGHTNVNGIREYKAAK